MIWRHDKHLKMHTDINIRQCKYFKNDSPCPFEELGCRFRHEENVELRHETIYTTENPGQVEDSLDENVYDYDEKFHTSTPSKLIYECDKCLNTSKCVDCKVKHMLGENRVARAIFDGCPQDRLHLLL